MARNCETIDASSWHDTIYVAVGTDVQESKLTLQWALQNFHGKKFCILHVHQPAELNTMISKHPDSRFDEDDLKAIQDVQRLIMHETLDDYLGICHLAGEHAENLHIEMEDIGEGLLKLIDQYNIEKLVMGAAADKHYSEYKLHEKHYSVMELQMTDLKSKKAIYVHLHVPLSCQIWFICNGNLIHSLGVDGINEEVTSPLLEASSITETGQSNPGRSPSPEESECGLEFYVRPQSEEDTPRKLDESGRDQLYNQLEQSLVEAEKLKREAFEGSLRRVKAEKAAIEAARKARALESSYTEELRRHKETQEELAKVKGDLEKMKCQYDEERLIALDRMLLLENQVEKSDNMMKDLASSRELSQFLKKERDELQELLEKQVEEASRSHMNQYFSEFSVSEIEEATSNFEPSSKIGEGGYGSIYKGSLRHTPVAIKVLDPGSMQGPLEFQQEVDVLSKLRHPNLVTLIGVCPDIYALIYEFLPNGSLEDLLSCKDNTAPLSWQTRIRIATELCSVLIFLHSSKPQSIVHGDLKPGNILLDVNFVCKLGDFGICRALSRSEHLSNLTQCHRTDPKGTFHYLDPQFLTTGELSPKSDTYAFGIILLQLLTGKSPLGIAKEVQDAINERSLLAHLDPLAGDWPFVQAKQLAHLALRCCEMDRSGRPDLKLEVWRMLEPMRASCRASSPFHLGPEELRQPPSYFMCPVYHEVMQDPHFAADGFTYEKEAITEWLESHDTSPMTNDTLEHLNLVPNHALRSVIQEWQEQH